MREKFFMQLILVLALLLMCGGKNGSAPQPHLTGSDMFEMLKYISGGNGEMDKIFKEVEQVTEIINTLAPLANFSEEKVEKPIDCDEDKVQDIGLILKPVANIADNGIYNALSHAIS